MEYLNEKYFSFKFLIKYIPSSLGNIITLKKIVCGFLLSSLIIHPNFKSLILGKNNDKFFNEFVC